MACRDSAEIGRGPDHCIALLVSSRKGAPNSDLTSSQVWGKREGSAFYENVTGFHNASLAQDAESMGCHSDVAEHVPASNVGLPGVFRLVSTVTTWSAPRASLTSRATRWPHFGCPSGTLPTRQRTSQRAPSERALSSRSVQSVGRSAGQPLSQSNDDPWPMSGRRCSPFHRRGSPGVAPQRCAVAAFCAGDSARGVARAQEHPPVAEGRFGQSRGLRPSLYSHTLTQRMHKRGTPRPER